MASTHWVYAAIDLGAAATALAVALWRRQQWLQHWRRSLAVVGLVGLAFAAWDVTVTRLGHWSFNDAYVTGWHLAGLPVEEVSFFVAIPLVCLAVWEACVRAGRFATHGWYYSLALPVVSAVALVTTFPHRGYSLAAGGAALGVAVWVYAGRRWLPAGPWLAYQLVMFGIFLVANSVLTGLPVVVYNPHTFSGLRLGTIPVEDCLYNFALTNAVVLATATLHWFCSYFCARNQLCQK
ncbi:MAG TPA: lycopene cyclase domain-containing protein [Candidatus Saccharimonadia bacterium]